jgi:palmitoyl-protein thioesterase
MLKSLLLALPLFAAGLPQSQKIREYDPNVRPLVLWHGLGDAHANPGILEFIDMMQEIHPGLFVHSVYIKEDLKEDTKAAWVSNKLVDRAYLIIHTVWKLIR